LIGGVYAAYFSTALIFISLVGASYILFVFPAVQSRYLELSSVYMSDYTNFGAGLVAPTNVERFTTGLTAGPQPSAALDASIGNLATDYLFINAEKMHSLRLVLDFADFLRLPFLSAGVEFVVDSLSIIMVFTVTCISFFVHLYSTVYMREDPHATRFFGLLSFFTFFMIVLVEASNLVMLYVGWEGVGLSSFLLIAFWYTRVPALKAAVKAVLINKIGDMFLIFAIAVITAFSAGRTTISELPITFAAEASAIEVYAGLSALDLAALALVLAAFVKSAQIFFHTWLPDAMEGPTPVSALLHAATMVTAGVYLVIRFSTIIEFSPAAKLLVLVGGLSTVVFSSVAALTQCDIKKIIAYSTCSQLGLMFFACGLSAYDLALFHFFNHAFFKCLLFLLAGIIIHELQNEQDIRRMGALAARMPATFVCFLAASFSLAGFPFFAGAASKDLILLAANHLAISSSNWGVKMFLFSTNFIIFLTAAYTARLVYFVFLAPVKAGLCSPDRTLLTEPLYKEPAYAATAALLAALSAVGGRVFDHLFVLTEGRFISVHEEIVAADYNNLTPLFAGALKWVPFLLTLSALLLAHVVWLVLIGSGEGALRVFKSRYPRLFQIYKFFSKKCYFDEMYNLFLIRPILRISYVFNRAVEDGIFKFTAFGLWRLAAYPKRWRLSTTRYTLVNHLLFSSVGTVFLIIGSFNFY
jgi:NADH-quinone oxidoreductase subunit L